MNGATLIRVGSRTRAYLGGHLGAALALELIAAIYRVEAPEPRAVQPPSAGRVMEFAEVGGLHHRYERRAA